MDALIIAAGAGSRLRQVAHSKPLAPILGTALIEISVMQAARAGVRRAVVVTGYRAQAVEAALPLISRRAGIPVEPERIDDWLLPNGHSVMAGASLIDGNYLLLMADHIFADPILSDLLAHGTPENGVTLAVDRRTNGKLIDPDDAEDRARHAPTLRERLEGALQLGALSLGQRPDARLTALIEALREDTQPLMQLAALRIMGILGADVFMSALQDAAAAPGALGRAGAAALASAMLAQDGAP